MKKEKTKQITLNIRIPQGIFDELERLYPQLGMENLSEFFFVAGRQAWLDYTRELKTIDKVIGRSKRTDYIG